jgi:pSer/pThr/pTyr-binding forkhead associated (FHA) protein
MAVGVGGSLEEGCDGGLAENTLSLNVGDAPEELAQALACFSWRRRITGALRRCASRSKNGTGVNGRKRRTIVLRDGNLTRDVDVEVEAGLQRLAVELRKTPQTHDALECA